MMEAADLQTSLTGAVPLVMLSAAVLAPLISWVVLRCYRRALIGGMKVRAVQREPSHTEAKTAAVSPPGNRLEVVEFTLERPDRLSAVTLMAVRRLRESAIVNVGAGLCAALVLAMCIVGALSEHVSLNTVIPVTAALSWPTVLCLHLLLPPSLKTRVALVTAYVGLVGVIVLATSFESRRSQGVLITLAFGWYASFSLLMTVLLWRRIRAVGTMTFLFVLSCLTGGTVALEILRRSDSLVRGTASMGHAVGLGAFGTLWIVLLIAAVLFAFGGWGLLRLIGYCYDRRYINDLGILTDSIWLVYGLSISIFLVFQGFAWLFAFVAAFAAYRLALMTGQKLLRRPGLQVRNRIVELRVFSLGDNSARLFSAFSAYWRHIGAIRLIAGPDLATTTVEPFEFLSFLERRLKKLFIDDPATPYFNERINRMDSPDSDGRFRIDEFMCREDTWKSVFTRLITAGDPILMDLRGFSNRQAGCSHELHTLMDTVPMERVVLVVDNKTDRTYLKKLIEFDWRNSSAASPNRAIATCRVRLFLLDKLNQAKVLGLVQAASESETAIRCAAA
jgi:hypothetical protein